MSFLVHTRTQRVDDNLHGIFKEETLKPPTTYPQQLAKLVDTKLGLNWWNPSTKPTSNQETTPKSANAQTGPAKERESSSLSLVLEGVVALQVRF
jgi:hypothetical protein